MRGEFNFAFDIEIVFVVRRRTGTGGGGLGSCEELAVAMVWQWPVAGVPCPGLAWPRRPAAITLPRPGPGAESGVSVSVGHPGTVETVRSQHRGDVTLCHSPMVTTPTSHSDRDQTPDSFMP